MRHLLSLSAIESAKVLEKGGYKPYAHLTNMVRPHASYVKDSYAFYLGSSHNQFNLMVIQTFIKKLNNNQNSYVTILYQLPYNEPFVENSIRNRVHKYNTTFTFTLCFQPCAIHVYQGKTNRLANAPGLIFYNKNLTDLHSVYRELENTSDNRYNFFHHFTMKKSISKNGHETSLRDLESGNYTVEIH